MVVPLTQALKDAAIAGVIDYNDMQSNGASATAPYAVDDVVVASPRSQQSGQSNTPLFLPYNKIDPTLDPATTDNMEPQQIVYKQLSDNGVLPIFLALARMGTLNTKWILTTRSAYGVAIGTVSTFTYTNTGNLPASNGTSETGVPVSGDLVAQRVEVIRVSTGLPVIVLAGPQTGERVYGIVSGGSSPDNIQIDLYSAPLGADPSVAGTPYTWEAGNGASINIFYGFRQRLDQLDDTAFRRIFR